jgi:NADH:ubiquinone oxidoreductase subunit C
MQTDRISKVSVPLEATVARLRNSTVLTIKPERIIEACKLVVEDGEFYHLTTITALDEGQAITLFYHFWRGREFITLKTSVSKPNVTIQSISGALPAAVFYEAEIMDLFGVVFEGNPMVGKKLILPDNYPPEAPPPYRKEADPAKIRRMMGLE